MHSNDSRELDMLKTSQILMNNGEFEQALACIQTMNCVMGEWMKGKIYFHCALQISNTFTYKYYPTMEIKSEYQDMLNKADDHLSKAATLLPNSTDDIKIQLNKCLWYQIGQVQNALAATKEIVEENDDDLNTDEDYSWYYQVQTENLIEDISELTF